MAVTVTPIADPISALGVWNDTDAEGTAVNNIRPGATKLHVLDIDNAANGAVSYFKVYDSLGPTIGTTDPDWILPVAASVQRTYLFTESDVMGLTIANGISYACVTAGGTAGTTNPTSAVIVDGVANA